MNITTKQFQLLTDINLIWDFLVDIYDRETCFLQDRNAESCRAVM